MKNYIKNFNILFILILIVLVLGFESAGISRIKPNSDYMVAYIKYKWINWKLFSHIEFYAKKYNIPPLLVCALIQQESGGEKYARGRDGEYGYMQPLPLHFEKRGISHKMRFEPEYNLEVGCHYLAGAIYASDGNYRHAIRRYNQGYYGREISYQNWQYVYRVLNDYKDSLKFKEMEFTSAL